MRTLLGRFEEQVLMAVLESPGLTVAGAERALGCSIGQAHAGLRRLEAKGLLIQSGTTEPKPQRGGRATLPYRITAQGRAMLAATVDHDEEMVARFKARAEG